MRCVFSPFFISWWCLTELQSSYLESRVKVLQIPARWFILSMNFHFLWWMKPVESPSRFLWTCPSLWLELVLAIFSLPSLPECGRCSFATTKEAHVQVVVFFLPCLFMFIWFTGTTAASTTTNGDETDGASSVEGSMTAKDGGQPLAGPDSARNSWQADRDRRCEVHISIRIYQAVPDEKIFWNHWLLWHPWKVVFCTNYLTW